ncbi:sodium channel subunit beta-2 isoform X3 [Puntigrus tetrazona]|uniref:sodium channel subunit beta-2 isoform X3 n=1 Tax=Puntigrus tetrazona TaxID=1606681 RepID=UPI001C8A8935|nr:sodium channel subunit beta-2 isoform X3 [Puntigrus tetrazona]
MYSVIKKKTNFTGSSCSVMRCLFIVFIFTVHGTYGCVKTSPDQKVKAGTDVHLSCNFSQCPGPLDIMSVSVEWEFMDISSEPKIILYYIRNRTVPLPGVFFKGDVKLGSFDIQLQSVTDKNNGTYLCRLRLNGIFHKNQTHLIVQSALTRRILPGVNRLQTPPLWWPSLASVAGLVLLIGTMFLGRKAYRSTQRENNSKQNIEVVNNSSHGEDKGVTYRVGFSMPDLADASSPPGSPDNIYVTMHGFPLAPDAPVTAGRSRLLPSDWKPKDDEEPVYVPCHQDLSLKR